MTPVENQPISSNQEPLTEPQRAEFEQLLTARERELWAEVRALRESLSAPPDETGPEVRDQGDSGQRQLDLAQELTDLDRREREIADINAARLRMREGSYGYCDECGEVIPYGRLKAMPTARFCLRHEEQWERAVASGRV